MTSLYREDDLLGRDSLPRVVVEVKASIDAQVAALLGASRHPRPDKSKRPCLELKRVILRELLRAADVCRFANHAIRLRDRRSIRVYEPMFDESDREMRYVNADPLTAERLCGRDGCTAAAE